MMDLEVEQNEEDVAQQISVMNPTKIKIVGCGGGGSSAVNHMIESGINDVEMMVLNTDLQALATSLARKRIPIGQKITGGLGAGGNPKVGEAAATEDESRIKEAVADADMVIITAGMGGGTGTGSAPIVARIAKEAGALTIGVVTTPFDFEAKARMEYALEGIKKLRENVDSLIIVPNEQVMKIVDRDQQDMSYKEAFRLADQVLCQGVRGISEIITVPGQPNLDFADVKSVMQNQRDAILGVGEGHGENRATDAAQNAVNNPLLENCQIDGATKLLINIKASDDIKMSEIQEISNTIKASASKDVELFLGVVTDSALEDTICVTLIATGFKSEDESDVVDSYANPGRDESTFSFGEFQKIKIGALDTSRDEAPAKVSTVTPTFSSSSQKPVDRAADIRKMVAHINDDDQLTLDGLDRDSEPRVEPKRTSLTPDHPVKKDDLSQPAVWRTGRPLINSIDLSDD